MDLSAKVKKKGGRKKTTFSLIFLFYAISQSTSS
jgi:hypothetical protein